MANDLIEDGVVSHAQLGIQGENALAEADGAEYPVGVRVTNVTADSAYDLGGGQINDVITELDDVLVTSMETLLTELRTRRAGETVGMAVSRADSETELTVTLEGRP